MNHPCWTLILVGTCTFGCVANVDLGNEDTAADGSSSAGESAAETSTPASTETTAESTETSTTASTETSAETETSGTDVCSTFESDEECSANECQSLLGTPFVPQGGGICLGESTFLACVAADLVCPPVVLYAVDPADPETVYQIPAGCLPPEWTPVDPPNFDPPSCP